jgi:hypothetical protein
MKSKIFSLCINELTETDSDSLLLHSTKCYTHTTRDDSPSECVKLDQSQLNDPLEIHKVLCSATGIYSVRFLETKQIANLLSQTARIETAYK